jgi:carboxylate-amine ligase
VRPLIGGLLPRQGVPPVIPSWEAFAAMLSWVDDPRQWWWEVRPHATFAAFAHALVAWLASRFDAGEELGAPASWRIAENRWAAARDGLEGVFRDLETGARRPVRDVLRERLESLGPLPGVAAVLERNGAMRQRSVGDARAVARWLCDRFVLP